MRLTVIGSSPAWPNAGGAHSGYLVSSNGKRLLPSEIAEVDRRLWHKFFVFLKPSDGSSEVKLDLLRYTPLEDWFLEIEQRTPNYKPEETPAPEAATSNQA